MFVEGGGRKAPRAGGVDSGGAGVGDPVAAAPGQDAGLREAPTEWIEREIGELAAHIAAAMCRWLELVAEHDRRGAHEAWGFHSCGAWLAWGCSIDPRSAREHVRVARALGELPAVREAFSRGELSYSKVRAITRIATAETEAELAEMARFATAAQLERLVRGYRRCVSPEQAGRLHEERHLSCEWDEDGSLYVRGRLAPEDGALFLRALEAGEQAVRERAAEREGGPAQGGSAEPTGKGEEPPPQGGSAGPAGGVKEALQGGSAEPRPSRGARRADALAALCEGALAGGRQMRSAPERQQVVVHVDAAGLAGDEEHAGADECRIEDGPAICTETARRLACEGSLHSILHRSDGSLSAGRRTRAVPAAMRRALEARDEGRCRFPGCENRRWVDAHHIRHWARGGETKLDNLVLLCGHHHRLVHEGGFGVTRRADGELRFHRPDGREVPTVPSPTRGDLGELRAWNRAARAGPQPNSLLPLGRGEPFDEELAVAGLLARACPEARVRLDPL